MLFHIIQGKSPANGRQRDLLVDPVLLGGGPVTELLRLEPGNKQGYKIETDLKEF